MSVDRLLLQGWIAGAEARFQKKRKPFAKVPLVRSFERLANHSQPYVHTEKIDLTRARDFHVQETSEDIVFASIDLPIVGRKGMGNDTGLAVASFSYADTEGDDHRVIAICAYTLSGVMQRERHLRQVMIIPLV